MKDIFDNNKDFMKLDEEFIRILINYLNEKLKDALFDEDIQFMIISMICKTI